MKLKEYDIELEKIDRRYIDEIKFREWFAAVVKDFIVHGSLRFDGVAITSITVCSDARFRRRFMAMFDDLMAERSGTVWLPQNSRHHELGHGSGQPKYYCEGDNCLGYPYKASEFPHPPTCR